MLSVSKTVFAAFALSFVVAFASEEEKTPPSAENVSLFAPTTVVFSANSEQKDKTASRLALAENALRAGLPSLAEDLANEALDEKNLSNAERDRFLLVRAGAQLAYGDFSAAAGTLSEVKGNSPQKRLREALIAVGQNRMDALPQALEGLYPETLPTEERAWFFLTRALSETFLGKISEATADFDEAARISTSSAVRNQIVFVRYWAEVVAPSGSVPAEALDALKKARDDARGTPNFAEAAKLYAVALAKSGDRAAAANALRESTPIPENEVADFALIEGLLADDIGSEAARSAFFRAVKARPSRALQTVAFSGLLQNVVALSRAGKKEEAIIAGNAIEEFLSELPPDENVGDIELFTRSRVAFEIGDFRLAEKLSEELISRFPASPFVQDALRTRADIALQEKEFRRAVPILERLRATDLSADEKKWTDILIADCNFLSGDYTLASSAYAQAENTNALAGDELGCVFFQQVYSEILAGNASAAAKLLDSSLAKRVPAAWTMRTECVVIEALLRAGQLHDAANRAEKFLARTDLLPDFRLRILWIQALIALDFSEAQIALRNADLILEKMGRLDGSESDALRDGASELEARTILLKARAKFVSKDVDDALKLLAELRERYPDSQAAADSWLAEGRYFNDLGKPSRALVSYEALISRYGEKEKFADTVALAAFEAAQAAATLGQPEDAVKKMEELVSRYPKSPLVFYAKMRLADFFRILDDFDSALAVYDGLLAKGTDDAQKRIVEMRRADTLSAIAARAGTDSGASRETFSASLRKAEAAYERLFSLPDQPLSLKAEAGFKQGYAAAHTVPVGSASEVRSTSSVSDSEKKARTIYWRTVNETLDAARSRGGASALGNTGGYWLARCLFALAESYEKSGDYDSARAVYENISAWSDEGLIPGKNYALWRFNKIKEK